MRILCLVLSLALLAACGSSKKSSKDYTRNDSRAAQQRYGKKSSRKTSKKAPPTVVHGTAKLPASISEEKTTSDHDYISTKPTPTKSDVTSPAREAKSRSAVPASVVRAEALIGTRYRYGGTSPDRGFDCSGLMCYVLAPEGVRLPRTSSEQARHWQKKSVKDAVVGDLIFFGTGNRVTHVGLVAERTRNTLVMIHSSSSKGVRRDEVLNSPYWKSRLLWAATPTSR